MRLFDLLISFFLVAFGQPAWVRGFGVLAGAFGFALFWRAMLTFSRPRDRFFASLIWFSLVQAIQLSWMTTMDYMGPLILPVYLFLVLVMGAQFGVLSFFLSPPIRFLQALAIAGTWTLFEWSRLFFLSGFTWNPIGLALADSPYSLQFASVWGIFGLSFWVILSNLAALHAALEKKSKQIVLWAAVAFFPYLFGLVQENWVKACVPVAGNLNVALVQTALFPEQKELLPRARHLYIPAHKQWERILGVLDPSKKVDLIVLPEAALPFGAHQAGYALSLVRNLFIEEAFPPLKDPYAIFSRGSWKVSNAFLLQTLANQSGAHVIAGLEDLDWTGKYNAAFHFNPQNLDYVRYEKRVLVPIGEYIPLCQWTQWSQFIDETFGICSSFKPGTKVKIFHAQFPIGVSICLEETFGNLTRELRLQGAEIFVNLTNDSWFPHSKLPQQHFDHGRVRAAENGVPLLRACNTGVTGSIDCFGRPLDQLPINEEKASALYFSLPVRSYKTLYTWWGDAAILGISTTSLLSYFLFRKKKLP